MNSRLRRIVIISCVTFALGQPALTLGEAPPSKPKGWTPLSQLTGNVEVAVGQARILKTGSKVRRVKVENGEVLEIRRLGENQLALVGLKPGTTRVQIATGWTLRSVAIQVQVQPATPLEQASYLPPTHSAQQPSSREDSDASPELMDEPTLSVRASDPMACQIGQVIEQDIVVTNPSTSTVRDAKVKAIVSLDCELVSSDPPAQVVDSTLAWSIDQLSPGESRVLKLTVKPLTSGVLRCNTQVSFLTQPDQRTQEDGAEAKLAIECDGPAACNLGASPMIVVRVSNLGQGPATDVTVHQEPVLHEPVKIGTLQPGESRVIQAPAQARQTGPMQVQLIATCKEGLEATATHRMQVEAAELTLRVQGPQNAPMYQTGEYLVEVANVGHQVATNVNVLVGMPSEVEYRGGNYSALFDPNRQQVRWVLPMMKPGEKKQLVFQAVHLKEGYTIQRAVAWADDDIVAHADIATTISGYADVGIEVEQEPDTLKVADTGSYQILLHNKGSRAAQEVQIGVGLPQGMELVEIEASVPYEIRGPHIIFEPFPELAADSSEAVTVRVAAKAEGRKKLRVELISPSLAKPVITEEVTNVSAR